MISLKINAVPVLFIKAFTADDVQTILDFVRHAHSLKKDANKTVLFIDTPITAHTVESVQKLKQEGYRVCFRDHHGIDGEPVNDRDKQVESATARLAQLLGDDCQITVRRLHPACSTLVAVAEFEHALAIIADPDADGLTAAMKAAGIFYDELDDDAALLDGEPHLQVTGSLVSQLLAKGMATLPSFDPKDPKRREQAQKELFRDWVEVVQGNKRSQVRMEAIVVRYDEAVQVAQELAREAKEVVAGVLLVDCVGSPVFDVGTLTTLVEQASGCRISVIRKDLGPLAQLHGIQYSLAVAKQYQTEINLQKLLPPEMRSDLQSGIISNVSFLLHVSEYIWLEEAVPRLRELSATNWHALS